MTPPEMPPCQASRGDVLALESLGSIAEGQRYTIDVIWEEEGWSPPTTLPMPDHHASRLEWLGLEAFPSLEGHKGGPVRFSGPRAAAGQYSERPGRPIRPHGRGERTHDPVQLPATPVSAGPFSSTTLPSGSAT